MLSPLAAQIITEKLISHIRVIDLDTGEVLCCDVNRSEDYVDILVPPRPTAPDNPPTQIVTGVIESLLGATNSATEALKTLRSKLNELT